jgi:hypothetical protein
VFQKLASAAGSGDIVPTSPPYQCHDNEGVWSKCAKTILDKRGAKMELQHIRITHFPMLDESKVMIKQGDQLAS